MNTPNLKMLLCAAAILPFIGGCATEGGSKPETEANSECRPGRTLMCETRMGREEDCRCLSNDEMKDIYDLRPEKY